MLKSRWACTLLCMLGLSQGLAATPESAALRFTAFESAMDAIANDPALADDAARLAALRQLDEREDADLPAHQALVGLYRCYLHQVLKDGELDAHLRQLQRAARQSADADLLASAAYCEQYAAQAAGDDGRRREATFRAWRYVRSAQSATLRYWISIDYSDVAITLGRSDEAAEAAQTALDVARANGALQREIFSLGNLALAQSDLGFHEHAIRNNRQALVLAGDHNRYLYLQLNRGYILMNANQLEEARQLYEQIVARARTENDIPARLAAQINLAEIHARLGDQQKTLDLTASVIAEARATGDEESLAYAQTFRAFALLQTAGYDAANAEFSAAQKWFRQNAMEQNFSNNLRYWAEALARAGEHRHAFDAQSEHLQLAEKLRTETRERNLLLLKSSFDTEQKDRELASLAQTNRLQSLELDNQNLQRQRWIAIGGGATALLLAAVMVILHLRDAQRRLQLHAEKLDYQSSHDVLTGAWNRRYIDQFMAAQPLAQVANGALAEAPAGDGTALLLIIDIDHFKQINDRHGHPAGDAVLKTISNRLLQHVRESDRVARWGGEEFLIYLQHVQRHAIADVIARILDCISEASVSFEHLHINVTASVGFAPLDVCRDKRWSWTRVLALADQALYIAKREGRHRACGLDQLTIELDETLTLASAEEDGLLTLQRIPGKPPASAPLARQA